MIVGLRQLTKLTKLQVLELERIDALTNDILYEITKQNNQLKYLDVGNCKNITDDCFAAIEQLELIKLHLNDTNV